MVGRNGRLARGALTRCVTGLLGVLQEEAPDPAVDASHQRHCIFPLKVEVGLPTVFLDGWVPQSCV